MDVGFHRTDRFDLLACVEKESVFADSLELNRDAGRFGSPTTKVYRGPIETHDPRDVMAACGLRPGELDALVGGPPCQTFSTAGRRAATQDPRGMLLWQFLHWVEVLRPKYFVMENVRGLLSAATCHRPIALRPERGGKPLDPSEEPGSVVQLWLGDLAVATGGEYRVDCFEVNAVNYGAPQLRERALFFGNRLGHVVDFPSPTHRNLYAPATRQAELFDERRADLPPFRTLGAALDEVEADCGEVLDFSPRKKEFLAMVPEGGNWRTLDEAVQRESMGKAWHAKGGRSGWWRRLSRDLPCPTIVTMPNHASTSMCHPTETRALTLRECAAVQEFPAAWTFAGSTAKKYVQVGNALPVRLGEVAAEVLAAQLDSSAGSTTTDDNPPYRRIYLDSHVRTRQWFKKGVTFTWADGRDNSDAHYSASPQSSAQSQKPVAR